MARIIKCQTHYFLHHLGFKTAPGSKFIKNRGKERGTGKAGFVYQDSFQKVERSGYIRKR